MDAIFTGKQIAEARKALGLTQRELAEKLYVTDKAVSKWERGINFPDLGLLESLAVALETTPAQLLGLEETQREALIQSLTEIHREQQETVQRHIRCLGWCAVALGFLLALGSHAIGFTREMALQAMYGLWPVCAAGGIWLLFRYGEIRPFTTTDWLWLYGAGISMLTVCLGYLFMDHGLPNWLNLMLEMFAIAAVQTLCYRIFRSRMAKALPLTGATAFLIFHSLDGNLPLEFALLDIACASAWLLCRRADTTSKPLPPKGTVLGIFCGAMLLSLLCYTSLTQLYVSVFHAQLECYAQQLLTENVSMTQRYGLWKVTVYPEAGMVEFHTGGSGLVPDSTYEGFYYSAEDCHIPFQNANFPIDVNIDSGRWTGEGDNCGTSRRIREKWFWFQASFYDIRNQASE